MAEPTALKAAIQGLCPRCGQGPLFSGYLSIAKSCPHCGLDYSIFDVGDGATVFVILIAGFIVCGSALYVEVAYSPPYWVHALIAIPLLIVLPLILLRPVKGILLCQQYLTKAQEGRIDQE